MRISYSPLRSAPPPWHSLDIGLFGDVKMQLKCWLQLSCYTQEQERLVFCYNTNEYEATAVSTVSHCNSGVQGCAVCISQSKMSDGGSGIMLVGC